MDQVRLSRIDSEEQESLIELKRIDARLTAIERSLASSRPSEVKRSL
jgi:hypothetical protein